MQHGKEDRVLDDKLTYVVFLTGLTVVWAWEHLISDPGQFPEMRPVAITVGTSAAAGVLALLLFLKFSRPFAAIVVSVALLIGSNFVLFGIEPDLIWRFGTVFFAWSFAGSLFLLGFSNSSN